MKSFDAAVSELLTTHEVLVSQPNLPVPESNGIFNRWQNPVLTAAHTPIFWRYDLNPKTNPWLMERLGVNATFNAGAIYWRNKHLLVVRVEGYDRKSFFAVAESCNGVDNFRFWDYPICLPENDEPDVNVYDMRLTQHEDGYIYGLFCTERKDNSQPQNTSAADARCGIVRTKNFLEWERLPDLIAHSGQQRNVVLHPEFIDGCYGLYTRPQEGFIDVGSGGGIGWGLTRSMEQAEVTQELVIDPKAYHTIKELKNGQGPTPIRTSQGWLHLGHGVRNTAAGLRYVLYMFMTELNNPWVVTHQPGGYFLAPEGSERVGDVSNVVFCNGWTLNDNNEVFIYYASSDTRLHVATTSVEKLTDYVINTPPDGLCTGASVTTRRNLIAANLKIMGSAQ